MNFKSKFENSLNQPCIMSLHFAVKLIPVIYLPLVCVFV